MSGYDYEKDPDATLDYAVNWANWLNDDTIASSSWEVPSGVTLEDESNTTTTATVWISGGTEGTTYTLTNQIVTAAGRVNERDIRIWVHTLVGYTQQPRVRKTEALVTPTQVRQRLKLEQGTPDSVINEYITKVHSRIVIALGFDYPRDVQERILDTVSDPVLVLPGAGARRILDVTENGTTLTADDYVLDPEHGRTLMRLDSSGFPMDWVRGSRMVSVRYLPASPPEALVDAELVEVVRSYRAAQAGYADRVGPDGSTTPYKHDLASDTKSLIKELKKGEGVGVW